MITKQRDKVAGVLLLAWMVVVMAVFVLTKVSPEGAVAHILPSAFSGVHSAVYSFFYRPSVYE